MTRPGFGHSTLRRFVTVTPPLPTRPPATVPPALLGWEVSAGPVRVRLTEVEAYAGQGEDPASHAHRGRTPRNAVMFGQPGLVYAYFVFGVHWCLNIVCGPEGTAAAVLLRAGAVIAGTDVARLRRGGGAPGGAPGGTPGGVAEVELARGPARLAVALGLGGEANGTCAIDDTGPLRLTSPVLPVDPTAVVAGPRVGITRAVDRPWRFWIAGEPTVSRYRRADPNSGQRQNRVRARPRDEGQSPT